MPACSLKSCKSTWTKQFSGKDTPKWNAAILQVNLPVCASWFAVKSPNVCGEKGQVF